MPSLSVNGRMARMRSRHMIWPRITQKIEPPSISSSARLGTMRVVWMRSGFLPRCFCALNFCLIQSSRSATESVPTESLMRCSGIAEFRLLFHSLDDHHLGALGHLRVLGDRDLGHRAVDRRVQRVLHLHGLDDGDTLAAPDL